MLHRHALVHQAGGVGVAELVRVDMMGADLLDSGLEDFAELIVGGLKLPRRAMLKGASLWSTNPS